MTGNQGAGVRMDVPGHLMPTNNDLKSYAYQTRQSHGKGTKTHIKNGPLPRSKATRIKQLVTHHAGASQRPHHIKHLERSTRTPDEPKTESQGRLRNWIVNIILIIDKLPPLRRKLTTTDTTTRVAAAEKG